MFPLSLFCVFAVAKILVLIGRELPSKPFLSVAFFWQDTAVAVVVGTMLCVLPRRWTIMSWFCYGLLSVYAALNVPLARALGTPLTWQLSRATGGALSDSIQHYFTETNFVLMGMVLLTALLAPACFRRIPQRVRLALALTAIPLVLMGAVSSQRMQTAGLDRNPLMAFIGSCFPHVKAADKWAAWRRTDSCLVDEHDLHALSGSMADRNVIVIALESTAARYLKPYGAADDSMPNLSALVRDAIVAENAYSVYPESIKGLFSILYSRYPAFDISAEQLVRRRPHSFVETLRSHGYETALFHSGRFMYLGMDAIIDQSGFDTMQDAGAISGHVNSSFGVDEPATVERLLAWIDQTGTNAGKRFFITYLPIAGHHPYDTPERGPFPVGCEQDRYLNALHYGDRSLGDLFDGLKQRGLFTNTLFVIFGDHGEAFGQHDGNFAHTLFLYEENVHVPFLIAAPGKLSGQTRLRRPLSLIDVGPTLLDLLGVSIPAEFQGESWLVPATRLSLFYTDYSLALVGLRDGDWKFIGELGSERNQLYDLQLDPNEKTNLCARFPNRVSAYRQRLEQWSAAQKQLFCR